MTKHLTVLDVHHLTPVPRRSSSTSEIVSGETLGCPPLSSLQVHLWSRQPKWQSCEIEYLQIVACG